ncbi:hypothetical protein Ac2012v2_006792 [Leucoagaricus gongylophorus]
MYSSAISSKPQSTRLLNTPVYSARLCQLSARVFKAPALGSCYAQQPKCDPCFQRPVASSNHYPSSRYEDTATRFSLGSGPQRPSHYVPPVIRTSHLTARDFPSRPPTQSDYIFSPGNTTHTYIYEQSDCYSRSDDTTTNDSCSPSLSPASPAMSIDSLLAVTSPLLSPSTERGERGQVSGTTATRHDSISDNNNTTPFLPLTGAAGSTISRSHPGQSSGSHEGGSLPLAGLHVADTLNSAAPILIPPASTSSSRSMKLASKVSHTATTATAPPLPSSTSVSLVPNSTSDGYAWHSIPTAPPSEVESEDVSLEARMNAEYNSIATGSLYTSLELPIII